MAEGAGKESPWKELRGQIYLGSERFVEQMQARVGPDRLLEGVPLRQRRPPAKPLAYYAEHYKDRDQAMAEAHYSGASLQRGIQYARDRCVFRRRADDGQPRGEQARDLVQLNGCAMAGLTPMCVCDPDMWTPMCKA